MVKLNDFMYPMTPKVLNLVKDCYFSQAYKNQLFRHYGAMTFLNSIFYEKRDAVHDSVTAKLKI